MSTVTEPAAKSSASRISGAQHRLLAFSGLVIPMIVFSIASPNFLQTANIITILQATSVNGVLAVAATLVIISGGIDLSVGTLMTFCAVIGGVLIPGAAAPKIVTKKMVSKMKKGAVVVDVAIDQGGCIETARPTTHSDPSYVDDGVVHYCVTNMPAAVPNTSTLALTNATFPYVMRLAQMGAKAAIQADSGLRDGVNTFEGVLTCKPVADSQGKAWKPVGDLVK